MINNLFFFSLLIPKKKNIRLYQLNEGMKDNLGKEQQILGAKTVTELNCGAFFIQGTFNATKYEIASQEEKFQLKHISGHVCFHLSRTPYQPKELRHGCENSSPGLEFTIQLSLEHASLHCVCCKDIYGKRTAVWASVNKCQPFVLESFSPGQWKSVKMPLVSLLLELEQTKVPYTLFINFSRTAGEINARMQFTNLYVNQLNCDVTFHFDTAEEDEQIGSHVAILSARSSVFAAMFQSGLREASTRKICIRDIKPDIFKQLLHYIYSGRTSTELSEEIAQPLFVAADMYDIGDLKDECIQFLLSCITLENALNFMAWAHIYSIDSLKDAALTFVGSHGKEICKQDDWERLTKIHPDLCLMATRLMLKYSLC
ncbi:BTB and MATH domain-containing protein 42-like [Daphnia carinata]|uniref:BTB and MATH domain-containing protein 42-like n=1 Tax=Daphnia carinata TaxID=120202 RepID=UPI00257FEFA4|nr:BTB and MATH domain-containing protein 42-like [Daphnia carinata]